MDGKKGEAKGRKVRGSWEVRIPRENSTEVPSHWESNALLIRPRRREQPLSTRSFRHRDDRREGRGIPPYLCESRKRRRMLKTKN